VFAGLVLLALCLIRDYHGYALFMWLYGLFLGASSYSLRVYTYEQARARNFARAIAFIQWVAFVPVLIGIPITGKNYILQYSNTTIIFLYVMHRCSLSLSFITRKYCETLFS
jgi:hypothetical protein